MNRKNYSRAKKILEGYGKDGLDQGMRDVVQGWLASEDSEDEKEAALRSIFDGMVTTDRKPCAESYTALAKSHKLLGFPVGRGRRVPLVRRLMRISAAAVAAAIIGSCGWFMYQNSINTVEGTDIYADAKTDADADVETNAGGGIEIDAGKIAAVNAWSGSAVSAEAAKTRAVANMAVTKNGGETKTVVLPDGSEIQLGKGSTLSFNEIGFLYDRTIQLEGDAYFKIVKTDGKTFTVNTSSIQVTVYGTEFHMNAYDAAATAEVRLTTGKVSVKAEGIEEIMMKAGDCIVYNKVHKTIELHEIGEAELMRLRGMSLSFEEPLDSILRNIGRQYRVKMKVQEGIPLDGEVVLELKGNETIEDVMFILKKATELFDYEIKQDTVIVYGRKQKT